MLSNRDAMLAYNKAAQLVGEDFANTLPDAMAYLSKVASATGQDMGFLTDSLVTGIGRLSPMILDNLGISVDLSEAYDVYAASVGKSVEELTKQEQQTALTNQVMEKLAENTAALPDVAGQADTKMAALGATFQDLKDTIGVFLLPVFTTLLDVVGNVLDQVANKWSVFQQAIEAGFGFWDALRFTFTDLTGVINFLESVWDKLAAVINDVVIPAFNFFKDNILPFIIDRIEEFIVTVQKVVGAVSEWINQHPDFVAAMLLVAGVIAGAQLITIAFSTAIGLVTTAVGLLKAGFALLFSPIVLVVGAITALIAWLSSGEGGLAGALTRAGVAAQQLAFIVVFALQTALTWLLENVITPLVNFVQTQLIPFLQRVGTTATALAAVVIGILGAAWNWFLTNILTPVVNFVNDTLIPIFSGIWNAVSSGIQDLVDGIGTAFTTIKDTIIQPVIDFVNNTFGPIFDAVMPVIQPGLDLLKGAFELVFGGIFKAIEMVIGAIGGIGGAISGATKAVETAVGTIGNLLGTVPDQLPSWATEQGFSKGESGNIIVPSGSNSGGNYPASTPQSVAAEGAGQDFGGRGMAGVPYRIGVGSKEEWFTPDTAGEFSGLHDPRDTQGGSIQITMIFNGVPDRATASEASEMLVTELRSRGIPVT